MGYFLFSSFLWPLGNPLYILTPCKDWKEAGYCGIDFFCCVLPVVIPIFFTLSYSVRDGTPYFLEACRADIPDGNAIGEFKTEAKFQLNTSPNLWKAVG